jgi:hypothetical protein
VKSALAAAMVLISGCATLPSGPSITALPGSGKSFEQFRSDDHVCRQYAEEQVSPVKPDRAADQAVAGGTAAGAASHEGHGPSLGEARVPESDTGSRPVQTAGVRYDAAYIQCMYAKGNRVPVSSDMVVAPPRDHSPPPPAGPSLPPPDFHPLPPSPR